MPDTKERDASIANLARRNWPSRDIAAAFNLSAITVQRILQRLGIPYVGQLPPRAERRARNAEIIELHDAGMSYSAIADRFGLTRTHVFRIVQAVEAAECQVFAAVDLDKLQTASRRYLAGSPHRTLPELNAAIDARMHPGQAAPKNNSKASKKPEPLPVPPLVANPDSGLFPDTTRRGRPRRQVVESVA